MDSPRTSRRSPPIGSRRARPRTAGGRRLREALAHHLAAGKHRPQSPIDALTEGVHPAAGSGIAASCFDVLRVLLGAAVACRDGRAPPRGAAYRPPRPAAPPRSRRPRSFSADFGRRTHALGARCARAPCRTPWRRRRLFHMEHALTEPLPRAPAPQRGNVLAPRLPLALLVSPAAHANRCGRGRGGAPRARNRSALRGAGCLHFLGRTAAGMLRRTEPWLEHAVARPRADTSGTRGCPRSRVYYCFHGHAGQRFPQHPIPGDGGARPHSQRARTERVPAHRLCEAAHRRRRPTSSRVDALR